jgi:RHS repeat-associated protein
MPYLFNAKERDEETGLYYYGARYLDPETAVWYGVDPLVMKYPDYSPYVYCANNPVNNTDPTGMDWYSYQHEYEDEEGNMQSQTQYKYVKGTMSNEDMKAGGYTHLGASANIALGNGTYANYYQNIGFVSDRSFDAKQYIIDNGLVGKYIGRSSPLWEPAKSDLFQSSIRNAGSEFMRGTAEFAAYSLTAIGDGATVVGTAAMAVPGLQGAGGVLISAGGVVSRVGTGINMGLNAMDGDWGQFAVNGASLGLSKGISRGLKNSSMTVNQKIFLDGFSGTQISTTNRIINWGLNKKDKLWFLN